MESLLDYLNKEKNLGLDELIIISSSDTVEDIIIFLLKENTKKELIKIIKNVQK